MKKRRIKMKSRKIKKNLSGDDYPHYVYLLDQSGERQKHYVDSPEDWKALQDVCEIMKMKIIIPNGKE